MQLTVTCQDDKLFLAIDSVRDDLGVGGDDLGFGFQRKVLLELEIPERSGEGEVTVDAAEFDKSARRGDPRSLLWVASAQIPSTRHEPMCQVYAYLCSSACGHWTWLLPRHGTPERRASHPSWPGTVSAARCRGVGCTYDNQTTVSRQQADYGRAARWVVEKVWIWIHRLAEFGTQTPRERCGLASPARSASSVFKNTSFNATS